MSPDGGSAFPALDNSEGLGLVLRDHGMSLRDYFAAKALAGMLSDTDRTGTNGAFARDAYAFADAMLVARGAP